MTSPDSPPLNRRRLVAFLLVPLVVAAVVDVAIYRLVRPEYVAYAIVEVHRSPAELFSQPQPGETSLWARDILNEMERITTESVLESALAASEVSILPAVTESASPREDLRAALRVVNPRDTNFICVSYASPSPEAAAAIVNAVVRSYLERTSMSSEGDTSGLVRGLERYADSLRSGLHQRIESLEDRISRSNRPGVVAPEDASPSSFTSLTEELARSTAERLVQVDLDLAREQAPEKAADLKKTQAGLRTLLALPVESREDDVRAQFEKRAIDDAARRLEEVHRKLEDAKFGTDRRFGRASLMNLASTPKVPSRDPRVPLMATATGVILMLALALGLQPGRARASVS